MKRSLKNLRLTHSKQYIEFYVIHDNKVYIYKCDYYFLNRIISDTTTSASTTTTKPSGMFQTFDY